MALDLEGANAVNFAENVSTGSINITTTGSNRKLIITSAQENPTLRTISSITTSGLTWTQRRQYQGVSAANGAHINMEVWEADAPTSGTYTALLTPSGITDGWNVGGFAAFGFDDFSKSAWDGNSSLAGAQHTQDNSAGNVVSEVTGVSTDDSNVLVFAFWTSSSNHGGGPSSSLTAASGWTMDYNLYNPNPAFWNYNVVQHKVFSSALSSATVAFDSGYTSEDWMMLVDALSQSGGGGGAPTFFPAAAFLCGV